MKALLSKLAAVAKGIASKVSGRLLNEPVMLLTAASIAFDAYKSAAAGGLTIGNAAFAGIVGALGFLVRQVVWPATKVTIDGALAEPAPAAPFIPGDDNA